MKKAIILGGSRGIGKAISDSLKKLDLEVLSASSTDIDTSDLDSVNEFAEKNKYNRYSSVKHRRSTNN